MNEDSEPERLPIADIINLEDNEKYLLQLLVTKTRGKITFENYKV